jgi:hypothetical protein
MNLARKLLVMWVMGCVLTVASPVRSADFLRGDVNTDGRVSLSDMIMLMRVIFLDPDRIPGEQPQDCQDAQDLDDNGTIDLGDFCRFLEWAYDGPQTAPPAPFPELGPDPTDEGNAHTGPDVYDCNAYELRPPVPTTDSVRIGEIEAAPGAEIELPIYITNSQRIEAFQFVIAYDSNVLEMYEGVTWIPTMDPGKSAPYSGPIDSVSLDGTFFDYLDDPTPGTGHRPSVLATSTSAEDGYLVVGLAPYFILDPTNPREIIFEPAEDTLILKIRGRVCDDAPAGTIALVPEDGPDGEGVGVYGLRNEVTYLGETRLITATPVMIEGELKISPDIVASTRGDANRDLVVDQTDAIVVLTWLFLGQREIACMDAADVNDDGDVDITILRQVILGESSGIAFPYPEAGFDGTLDPLDQCRGVKLIPRGSPSRIDQREDDSPRLSSVKTSGSVSGTIQSAGQMLRCLLVRSTPGSMRF